MCAHFTGLDLLHTKAIEGIIAVARKSITYVLGTLCTCHITYSSYVTRPRAQPGRGADVATRRGPAPRSPRRLPRRRCTYELLCDVSPWTFQRQLHPSWRGDRNQGQPQVINASFTIEGQSLNRRLIRTVVVHLDMESRAPCIENAHHPMASSHLQCCEYRSPQE